MDQLGLRRKDTTKGPPLRILSLDGGGVRGYSMLIILQELMHRTFVETEGRAPKRSEIPKPCEHFDLIVGTGTGGLIALMLGRLRMDIETCKAVYVRMTKRVFETDKTIAGIPYRSTLFKASKLEEAIRECVREHTVFEDEGNDEGDSPIQDPNSPITSHPAIGGMRPGSANDQTVGRSLSTASRYSQIGMTPVEFRGPLAASRWGKPNALLYDSRENRTKTAVTAVYKSTSRRNEQLYSSILLRSYDSRTETAVEPTCTIWQAGRATSATALAFKPIQVGQSVFLDEGAGKYNPAPQALDEAVLSEWPGREVGVLVSIGTGKRPAGTNAQQQLWWEGFIGGGMGDFAEARRRLIAKIEGCEETHTYMINKHLLDRGVKLDNYYRLNVDVGVGEFGMNEWNRLADISTNTRRYLATSDVQSMNVEAATKLARIYKSNQRWFQGGQDPNRFSWEVERPMPAPPLVTGAVELPAEDVSQHLHTAVSQSTVSTTNQNTLSVPQDYHRTNDDDKFVVQAPEPQQWEQQQQQQLRQRRSNELQSQNSSGSISFPHLPRRSNDSSRPSAPHSSSQSLPDIENPRPHNPNEPPPIPPKTPINGPPPPGAPPPALPVAAGHASVTAPQSATLTRPPGGIKVLPYPDNDGPPGAPPVNWGRKPDIGGMR